MDVMLKATRTARRVLACLLTAAAVTGCAIPHQISVTSPELGDSFTVTVDDQIGHVTGARIGFPVPGEFWELPTNGDGISIANLDDSAIGVGWTGGRCKTAATITVTGSLDALDLAIDPGRQCMEQVGVPKMVRLQFDAPIDASTVEARLTSPA